MSATSTTSFGQFPITAHSGASSEVGSAASTPPRMHSRGISSSSVRLAEQFYSEIKDSPSHTSSHVNVRPSSTRMSSNERIIPPVMLAKDARSSFGSSSDMSISDQSSMKGLMPGLKDDEVYAANGKDREIMRMLMKYQEEVEARTFKTVFDSQEKYDSDLSALEEFRKEANDLRQTLLLAIDVSKDMCESASVEYEEFLNMYSGRYGKFLDLLNTLQDRLDSATDRLKESKAKFQALDDKIKIIEVRNSRDVQQIKMRNKWLLRAACLFLVASIMYLVLTHN